ncbi:MAG: AbrB/MazE/SpoVT family DNA-binding domain-containing protein [Prochloraceae cyanobacterium]|nr:AbrB/MazE/SpoVT family DNA-binding domain-containing protein [Prochloraceae cyanobacterium]
MYSKIKIGKWGNSLGVRIPKDIAEALSLAEETEVKLIPEGDRLIIEPVKRRKKYTLEKLLEGMTEENVHGEIDWGKPQGQEWW